MTGAEPREVVDWTIGPASGLKFNVWYPRGAADCTGVSLRAEGLWVSVMPGQGAIDRDLEVADAEEGAASEPEAAI